MTQITPSGRFVSTGAPNRPYQLGLITLAIDAIQASISDSKVDFILDENSPEEGLAVQTFRYVAEKRVHPDWERLGEIRYADSEAEPGLQAADLYNYVWQRYLVREDEGKSLGREESYVMGQFGRMRTSIKVWRKSGMDLMLEQLSPEQRQKLKREA